jgi:hypothetical protein
MDFVNEGEFACHAKLNPAPTICETGDRLIISKTLKKPIPRKLQIGKYWALVFHSGQAEFSTHNQQNNNTNSLIRCIPFIHCEGTLTPIALYISTFVSHMDRAGFIDESPFIHKINIILAEHNQTP